MRLQVNLLRNVGIWVLAEVVFKQGQWHHQRHDAVQVLSNQLLHFLLDGGQLNNVAESFVFFSTTIPSSDGLPYS